MTSIDPFLRVLRGKNHIMKYRSLLFSICLLLFSANAFAVWYRVEVIVFENLYSDGDGEVWDKLPGLPEKDRLVTVSLDPAAAEGTAYQAFPENDRRLGGIYSALKFSKQYRPVLHMAWQQPGYGASRARNVQIRKEEGLISEDGIEVPLIKVDGVVKIRSTRLLHVDVDLAWFFQSVPESFLLFGPQPNEGENTYRYARIKESRKIKLNEVHYFDHPLFGVLIQVSRLGTE